MSGFDRIRPRGPTAAQGRATGGAIGGGTGGVPPRPRDPQGREALYSTTSGCRPLPFSAVMHCSGCGVRTAATLPTVVAQSVVGVHLPWLRRGYGSFMRCPACRRFRWLSVRIGLF